jgi:hypothetical protein
VTANDQHRQDRVEELICGNRRIKQKEILKGKEPTRCDRVCSVIASTCFGHQYAHHQEYN